MLQCGGEVDRGVRGAARHDQWTYYVAGGLGIHSEKPKGRWR